MSIDSAIWRKFPSLKPSILQKNSDFRRHPDVLKGNSSSDQLLREFGEKLEVFLSFVSKMDFNLNLLCRFFSFYVGSKVKNEYFWFLVHKVFHIKCVEFQNLEKVVDVETSTLGFKNIKIIKDNSRSSRVRRVDSNQNNNYSRRGNTSQYSRNNNRSPSNVSSYTRSKMVQLNNNNGVKLRNQAKFLDAVNILKRNIYSSGLSFLLGLKNQFQIYEKDAAILESRGAFMKTPNYQQMRESGKILIFL